MQDSTYIYTIHEMIKLGFVPNRMGIQTLYDMVKDHVPFVPRPIAAGIELSERLTRDYIKRPFGITQIKIANQPFDVVEKVVCEKAFCRLKKFTIAHPEPVQKLLIVAPMAGHHATLLRDTVYDLLPHYEVYITDWIDARQVPIAYGSFDLNDYIDYIIEFTELLHPNLHIMAVCQPTVPVLCAAAHMSAIGDKRRPKSLILIGGPVDTRISPTQVNTFAMSMSMEWFQKNLITMVPNNYPGFMRLVYPGFLQLLGFISMNSKRHIKSHIELFQNIAVGDEEAAAKKRLFYDEYFSVMDLPAEFYLQTIERVFKNHELPRGRFYYKHDKIDLDAITDVGILGIEGAKDDITGVGQTLAALKLCENVPDRKKHYHLQPDTGHYGSFSGSKFKQLIVPVIAKFTKENK